MLTTTGALPRTRTGMGCCPRRGLSPLRLPFHQQREILGWRPAIRRLPTCAFSADWTRTNISTHLGIPERTRTSIVPQSRAYTVYKTVALPLCYGNKLGASGRGRTATLFLATVFETVVSANSIHRRIILGCLLTRTPAGISSICWFVHKPESLRVAR